MQAIKSVRFCKESRVQVPATAPNNAQGEKKNDIKMNYCPNCQIGIDYLQMKERHCNNCGHDWESFHVTPNNDTKDHIESYTCHCTPEVRHESGNMIIIHNSFDGREGVEWTNEILNP